MAVSRRTPRACVIATFKDEAPFLLEWISHHKAVGFAEMVIASNNCTDGTDEMLDQLDAHGHLTHVRNPGPYKISIQGDAYQTARLTNAATSCEWLMTLDADEFLNVHVGQHTVADLVAHNDDDADAILVNWRLFGDSHKRGYVPEPVTEQFTLGQSTKTKRWPVKTLFRDDERYLELRPHAPWGNPALVEIDDKKIVTASGVPQGKRLFNEPRPFRVTRWGHRSWKTAQVNHYIVKTKEMFFEKARKGTAWPNAFAGQRLSEAFFDKMNYNDEHDDSILAVKETRERILEYLMSVGSVAKLHEDSCQAYAQTIRTLAEDIDLGQGTDGGQ